MTPIGTGNDLAIAGLLQPDGKNVVAGCSFNGSTDDFALVRYLSDGELDTSFSMDGKVTTELGGNDYATGIARQPDG